MQTRIGIIGAALFALAASAQAAQQTPTATTGPTVPAPAAPAAPGAPGGRGTFGPPAPLPTEPELVGTLPYATAMAPVRYIMVQIGDGGSGRYKSVLVGDPTLTTHTLYRPKDLRPFGPNNRMPIVAYGNGGCANRSNEVRNFLTEIASRGFLIVVIGPAIDSAFGGTTFGGTPTTPSQLLDAVAWATAENTRAGSQYFGKVDTTKVAVMGQSCGGVQAMDVSLDPRVSTTVMLNSGLLPPGGMGRRGVAGATPAQAPQASPPAPAAAGPGAPGGGQPPAAAAGRGMGGTTITKEALAKLHAPVLYLVGGKGDVAFPNAADDFARIQTVPVFLANRDVGHYPATYLEPRGGAFGIAASAWLEWQLKGDQNAAKMFKGGDKCGLCADPKWTIEKKQID
jgi:hypothetical protein